MTYLTIQEARKELNATGDEAKLCPSCYDVLKEWDGDDGKPNWLSCTNEMCLDETEYPIN